MMREMAFHNKHTLSSCATHYYNANSSDRDEDPMPAALAVLAEEAHTHLLALFAFRAYGWEKPGSGVLENWLFS